MKVSSWELRVPVWGTKPEMQVQHSHRGCGLWRPLSGFESHCDHFLTRYPKTIPQVIKLVNSSSRLEDLQELNEIDAWKVLGKARSESSNEHWLVLQQGGFRIKLSSLAANHPYCHLPPIGMGGQHV